MTKVYLGFGSNLGDREKNIKEALSLLSSSSVDIIKVSSFIETEPVDCPYGDNFINAAAEAETELSPQELLSKINSIEIKLGRVRDGKNIPRVIDIDILTFGNIKLDIPELTIPHPRMFERDFVLTPLKQIGFPENRVLSDENN